MTQAKFSEQLLGWETQHPRTEITEVAVEQLGGLHYQPQADMLRAWLSSHHYSDLDPGAKSLERWTPDSVWNSETSIPQFN